MQNSIDDKPQDLFLERRTFISTTLKATGATALLTIPGISMAITSPENKKSYTVNDIIALILKEIPEAPFKDTVDTINSGSGDQQVTGTISTMFATVDVIKQAAKLKANFIIAHEPTFYNHTDDAHWIEKNDVLKQKQALLKQHGIVVWRFHDYWHAYNPDGIVYGVLKQIGWEKYYQPGDVIKIPAVSLGSLITQLKSKLDIKTVRVIGDLDQTCERIALMPGAAGGQSQVTVAEQYKPDVLIVGELHEWETAEYIRDARALGSKISLVVLGHSVSEEPGMQWLVEWLQPKLEGVKVTHIASNSPFVWA